jgi:hypothetical protein
VMWKPEDWFRFHSFVSFNLISKLTSAAVATFCVVLFYLTPFAIEWSNAILIESFANFFLILAAVFLRVYFERGTNYFLILFGTALGFCALIKITTALPVIFFLIIFLSWDSNFEFRIKQLFRLSTVVIISIIPSLAWTRYADSIKEKGLFTEWLTSGSLQNWNFGTVSQRFSEADWIAVFARFWLLGGLIFLLLFPIFTIIVLNKSSVTKLLFVCVIPIIAPFVFFNLYVVHDYYFMAILFPSILSFSYLLRLTQNKFSLNFSRVSFLCILGILLLPSWIFTVQNRDYKSLIVSARSEIPAISNEITLQTSANDRILVVGCDWDPSVLFYADRYGIAAPGWIGSTDEALEILRKSDLKESPNFLAICGSNLSPSSPVEKGLTRVSENIWKIEDVDKLN